MEQWDVAVIGAGIAGASVAAELARQARVILIERESQPGYHTTGRSAALFSETYGPAPIRALSRASADFFRAPPESFSREPLVSPRGVLLVARRDQAGALDHFLDEVGDGAVAVDAGEARRMMPLLREDYIAAAAHEAEGSDIDVHALHSGYLRCFREAGGKTVTDREVRSLTRDGAGWLIDVGGEGVRAAIVVNAAGAWADEIGAMAGAGRIGLVPKRRTALTVAAPEGRDPKRWPMVVDIDEQFYLKPESGRLLISPADETPSPPCDAQPDELDIAVCIDRIETAFDLQVRRIENKWAGLRSFVADKAPVAGFDGGVPGFFWLAGQGGYGIQSAPALSRFAAALALGNAVPADILNQGIGVEDLSPQRPELAA